MEPPAPYGYAATVVRVVDGGTVRLRIDLGLHVHYEDEARLHGIDCPDVATPEGQAAKGFVDARLAEGSVVRIRIEGRDKQGRPVATVYHPDEDGAWVDLGAELVDAGHAVPHAP